MDMAYQDFVEHYSLSLQKITFPYIVVALVQIYRFAALRLAASSGDLEGITKDNHFEGPSSTI